MKLRITDAAPADAPAITALRNAAADDLTRRFGKGHWSWQCTADALARDMAKARFVIASRGKTIVATLRLDTKKPWAIDPTYFTPVARPLYLTAMAVLPAEQGRGVGRALLDAVPNIARDWPADAIRLDAYDTPAGAGGFYAKCGYTERGRVTYRGTPLVYFEWVLK